MIIACYIIALVIDFVFCFSSNSRGAAKNLLTVLSFISMLLIFVIAVILVKLGGWWQLLWYTVFTLIVMPFMDRLTKTINPY
jgi:hypothetical protein